MPIHAEELPLAVRRKLGIDAGKSSTRSRAGTGMGAPCPGTCAACGKEFSKFTEFERHSKRDHRRWVIDLGPRENKP